MHDYVLSLHSFSKLHNVVIWFLKRSTVEDPKGLSNTQHIRDKNNAFPFIPVQLIVHVHDSTCSFMQIAHVFDAAVPPFSVFVQK